MNDYGLDKTFSYNPDSDDNPYQPDVDVDFDEEVF